MKIYRCQSCGEEFRLEMSEEVDTDDLYCPSCGTDKCSLKEIKVAWVVMGGKIGEIGYCTRCGEGLEFDLPLPVTMAVAMMAQFCWDHRCCPAGMKHQEPPVSTPQEWIASRDVGISSMAIWTVMTGDKHPYIQRGKSYHVRWSNEHPCDSVDFGRCYRLLKLFPDWRPRLGEVSTRFPWWKPFVEHWDELTALYEKTLVPGDGTSMDERAKASRELHARLRQLEEETKATVQG